MSKISELVEHLQPGRVYRRVDIAQWSSAVDRHLNQLQENGMLQKLAPGMYYYPKKSAFGDVPPEEHELVKAFLKDPDFLIYSLNSYHALGLGTSQLYNETIVYNHKRHGRFKLGNRYYDFRCKPYFPKKISKEFLLVDMVNNLDQLVEDIQDLTRKIREYALYKADTKKIKSMAQKYGHINTKKFFNNI